MRRILFAALLLGATASGALAAGPVALTDAQLDTVKAGVLDVFNNNFQSVVIGSSAASAGD